MIQENGKFVVLVYLFLLFDADVICIERLFDTRSCKATGSLSFHKLESLLVFRFLLRVGTGVYPAHLLDLDCFCGNI
ncbi:hypothetical protein NC652_028388 [Populus alba x Populus x berolinensis]|nr:hypothetical protein NC652_028388 [Populus alba x Populus x berolinensis]